jgi:ribonuclease HI
MLSKMLVNKMPKIYPEIVPKPIYKLQFDGCSKGNPGLAGAGAVIYQNDHEIWYDFSFLGKSSTNNQAEYNGLLLGLNQAINLNITEILVEGDSDLVIKQMNNKYKVKSENLIPLYEKAKRLESMFEKITFTHIYRNKNKRADELANQAVENLPPIF